MINMDSKKIFLEILNSSDFKEKLQSISNNYPNLKQENFIRNTLLEILNEKYFENDLNLKAFAEHPREIGRTDLSIVNKETNQVFKVELKFQFTKDDKEFINYGRKITQDFITKESDLFILIVCSFDIIRKKEFDKSWGISSNLPRYHSKTDVWKENITTCFKGFIENAELQELDFTFSKPYPITYHFYLLNKN